MRPEPWTRREYVAAFRELAGRIEASLRHLPVEVLPIGMVHEDAQRDPLPLILEGIDPKVLDVRILTPIDLAVSKLGRFSAQDRADIEALARRGLITAPALETRALEALGAYVGDTQRQPARRPSSCPTKPRMRAGPQRGTTPERRGIE